MIAMKRDLLQKIMSDPDYGKCLEKARTAYDCRLILAEYCCEHGVRIVEVTY